VSPSERLLRRILVICSIIIILIITGAIIYPVAKMSLAAKLKYPPADCGRLAKSYELRSAGMWELEAQAEFKVNQKYIKLGK
tara:strand:- start:527 stop:772 length:246 start_codon:yes stop_codon:yes gene_type:complete